MMMYDDKYLKAGIALAKQHANQFDMETFADGPSVDCCIVCPEEIEPLVANCETTFCLAGWTVIAAMRDGASPVLHSDGSISWYQSARKVLNLQRNTSLEKAFYSICHLCDPHLNLMLHLSSADGEKSNDITLEAVEEVLEEAGLL